MDKEKARTIMELAQGMTRSEWNCIVHVINRKFDDEAARIQLTHKMAEGAMQLLEFEIGS